MIPGEYILGNEQIEANSGKETIRLVVKNGGDRPVQVGSHYHFFETNKSLFFNRTKAFGMRLDIPAGTAVRFEPGQDKEVQLVAFGGLRMAHGLNSLTSGHLDDEAIRNSALGNSRKRGFGGI